MRFEHFEVLYFIWLMVPLMAFLMWFARRRWKLLGLFAEEHLLWKLATLDQKREGLKVWLLVIAVSLLMVSLARPQWGFRLQEVKQRGIDILLAIDTSRSMLTADVRPNRIERVKLAVRDLIKILKGDRVGLIAFAGDAFSVCPLSNDYGGVLLTLEEIDVSTIPRGGTNIASAIEEAIAVYKESDAKDKTLVILTDGEELEGDALEAAVKAKQAGIRIYTVGIGTAEGELIQIQAASGKKIFLKDSQSNFVKSRLNEALLEKIALSASGLYVRASGAEFGLDRIYEQELSRFEERDFKSQMKKVYFERFQWPLALGIIVLIWETCLSTRRKRNPL